MLYTPVNHFNWQVDNFGTMSDSAQGTEVPGHANANTKGANTALLAGIAEDCYGIAILMSAGHSTTVIRRHLTDLLIDPDAGAGNAGSSWSVKIDNLYANSPAMGNGGPGWWYYFPLFLKAGTAIGAAHQDLVAASNMRMGIRVYGKPSRPDLVKVGNKVQTLGAVTATTSGTAVTMGVLGAQGSYSATLGTLNLDSWWWQLGIGSNDASMSASQAWFDIACNATTKVLCAQEIPYGIVGSAEQAHKGAMGAVPPIQNIGSGQDVYVRGVTSSTAFDTTITAVVYAVS